MEFPSIITIADLPDDALFLLSRREIERLAAMPFIVSSEMTNEGQARLEVQVSEERFKKCCRGGGGK